MKNTTHLKIAVLDDSEFYSRYLAKQLEAYEPYFTFENKPSLQWFVSTDAFLESFSSNIDIAFIDFFLDNGLTALDILPRLRRIAPDCEFVVISQQQKARHELEVSGETVPFILKNADAAMRGRLILHDLMSRVLVNRQMIH